MNWRSGAGWENFRGTIGRVTGCTEVTKNKSLGGLDRRAYAYASPDLIRVHRTRNFGNYKYKKPWKERTFIALQYDTLMTLILSLLAMHSCNVNTCVTALRPTLPLVGTEFDGI